MRKLFNSWRYYCLDRREYRKCMRRTFLDNLGYLFLANNTTLGLTVIFSLFPIFQKDFEKAIGYLVPIVFSIIINFLTNIKNKQHKEGKPVKYSVIYSLIILFYINVLIFGIYLGIIAGRHNVAATFIGMLICMSFLFNVPPMFSFCTTVVAASIFITVSVYMKKPSLYLYDIQNVLLASCLGLIFGWQIIRYRIRVASVTSRLESESKLYYDQSTIDELTQLKNRRDFLQTFQRFLTSYRQSDKFLCIAIMDIDFFKNYNDFYGHLKGDECLRSIGRALRFLQDSVGIYAARVGGEEFALIWFEEAAANVTQTIAQITEEINELNIPHEKSTVSEHVTVSIGVHMEKCGTSNDTNLLYDLADKAMYNAKANGRNQAVVSS